MPIQASDWETTTVMGFLGGINRALRADQIENHFLRNAKNVYQVRGEIRVDWGIGKFLGAVRGTPQNGIHAFFGNKTDELVLATTATLYRRRAFAQWQYIPDAAATTTTTAVEPAGEAVIAVADRTGFDKDQFIGLILDDGSEHRTQIIPGYVPAGGAGNITIVVGIPVGRQSDSASPFVKAIALSGLATVPVAIIVVPSDDVVIISNFVDAPQSYNKTDCADLVGLPSAGDTEARALGVFLNRLFMGHLNEGGTDLPRRYRFSAAGDITDWSGTDAGFNSLFDTPGYVQALRLLGPLLVVYKEDSIIRAEAINRVGQLLSVLQTVSGEGALSPRSVIAQTDLQIFIGNSGIYFYRGGLSIERISLPIEDLLFGSSGELDPGAKEMTFSFSSDETHELMFAIPKAGDTAPSVIYRYNTVHRSWLRREFGKQFLGMVPFKETDALTWATAPGIWTDYPRPWNSRAFLTNAPKILLLGSDGQVYEYTERKLDDDGVAISFELETKDFMYAKGFIEVTWLDILCAGNQTLTIEYSVDVGNNFFSFGSLTLDATMKFRRVAREIAGRSIRFKISGSGSGFRLGSISITHREQTTEV